MISRVGLGVEYFFLGEGDYPGYLYRNRYILTLSPAIDVQADLSMLFASSVEDQDIFDLTSRHNIHHIISSYGASFKPISLSWFTLGVGGGFSYRYRSEIKAYAMYSPVYSQSGIRFSQPLILNHHIKTWDYGYNFEISATFVAAERLDLGLSARYMGFNEGSSFFSIGLGLNYKLCD